MHRLKEIKIKVILLGAGSVGKTSLALRFTQDKFIHKYRPSLGVDFLVRRIVVDGITIKFLVFDTGGQELIETLRRRYYSGAAGAIIVFDVTGRDSFERLGKWIDEVRKETDTELPIALVGNKIDLEADRQVLSEEGKKYAESVKARYFESSALTGEGVSDIFEYYIQLMMEDLKKNKMV